MRISDWSSDVCSSDLRNPAFGPRPDTEEVDGDHILAGERLRQARDVEHGVDPAADRRDTRGDRVGVLEVDFGEGSQIHRRGLDVGAMHFGTQIDERAGTRLAGSRKTAHDDDALALVAQDIASHCTLTRSEEHTSELQSLMRISYAVFCLTQKNNTKPH